jgi:signal transduction histidine kinase
VHALVTAFGVVNTIIFTGLSLVAVVQWRRRRASAAGWLALAFLSLGLIVTLGRLAPTHPHGVAERIPQRLDIELLVLFPYFLYRFATAFVPPSRRLQRMVLGLTTLLSVWTFALPSLPSSGEPRPDWFVGYIIAFLVHWALLSIVVTVRLWRAGQGQPGVARTRMRLLGFAAAALTIAIVGTALGPAAESTGALLVAVVAAASGLAFIVGLAPPRVLRVSWRHAEQQRLQEAIRSLMTLATTREEIAERILGPVASVVGARAAAILDGDDHVLAVRGLAPHAERLLRGGERPAAGDEEVVPVEAPGATLLVWTSTYAPFFGDDELGLLSTMAAMTGIALDRVRLFEHEHSSRVALEHANELMADFVALAAHELRTPVTTIHGFVQTLNRLGDRLDQEQKVELRTALEQQTVRMASLVEQLLDLSRLDAEAVDVSPRRVDLRARLQEVVAIAAGAHAGEVQLDLPDSLDAVVDPAILDHIVTNLVTNAFRYGQPPVRVSARLSNGNILVAVDDAGPGVAREIEESLFERFTRAGVARDRVAGTGLGLAIAQAYAHAHRGELRYERGDPAGARFVVELPVSPAG